MADAPPAHHPDLAALRQRLADPRPICLALLDIDAAATTGAGISVTVPRSAVTARVDQSLRPYDEYLGLDDHHAILLPTLADAQALSDRLGQVFRSMGKPYEVDGRRIEVTVILGAAVRRPEDDIDAFLDRAGAAMEAARAAEGQGPVLF